MGTSVIPPADTPAKFLGAKACGTRYGFSSRHWLRLVNSGRAPQPTRFGRLVRWSIADLESWESAGCPRIERRIRS